MRADILMNANKELLLGALASGRILVENVLQTVANDLLLRVSAA